MLCLCSCSSSGWACQGPKHVEDSNMTYMFILKCALKLVEEITSRCYGVLHRVFMSFGKQRTKLRKDLLPLSSGKKTLFRYTWLVQKVSGLTTVLEVDKAYGVLTLIVFNMVPLRSYTFRPAFLPLLETFCELLFRDV